MLTLPFHCACVQEAALAVEAAGAEIPGAAQRPHLLVKAMVEAAMPCRLLS